MEFPKQLRYTKNHEWARKQDNRVTIGITAFAVEQLGDITLLDLPDVGSAIKAGESFGTIESVKSVSDLYAPVSGKVTRINTELEDAPEKINASPYEEGWMIEVELTGNEYEQLYDPAAYTELVNNAS